MKIYKLKFTDESEWIMVADLIPDDAWGCEPVHVTPTQIPEFVEGEPIPEPVPIPGYHIDVILSDGTEVNKYIVTTSSPSHVFAGCTYPIAVAVPDSSWLKAEIQRWLTEQGIEWDSTMLKAELLTLIP